VRRNIKSSAGFTLIDTLAVLVVIGILSAMAVPGITSIRNQIVLGEAVRQIRSELQTAKLLAVTSNRPIRVRFNCPSAGDYRMTELIGTPTKPDALDDAATRCSEQLFPYPAADITPLTRPNHDGPIRKLDTRVQFGGVQTIEFWPDGTARIDQGLRPWTMIGANPVELNLVKGTLVKTITVNGLGKIQSN
jgi:type II secretory pathway pseudopilin PulG